MPFTPESFAAMIRSLPAAVASDSLEEAKQEIGNLFRDAQNNNFLREQDSSGATWAPRTRQYPWLILRKTLKMINAASQLSATGNITEVQHRRMVLGIRGSDVPYAKYHQFGTSRLPRRQFFYLRKQDRPAMKLPIRKRLFAILELRKRQHRG